MKKIIIIVDCQHDFINPNGALYVPGGQTASWKIYDKIPEMDGVVFTTDWHPVEHCSFEENGGEWNRHCVNYSHGASIPYHLLLAANGKPTLFLEKGKQPNVEEYGAFENEENCTKFAKWLGTNFKKEKDIEMYICGVAGDYCVYYTAKSLMEVKPKQITSVYVLSEMCPCINPEFDFLKAFSDIGIAFAI